MTEHLINLSDLDDPRLEEARAVYVEYLADPEDPPWRTLLLPDPGVSVGLLLEDAIVGVAYGRSSPRVPGTITLQGIDMQGRHARAGRGSRLLRFFETRARDAGYDTVSLGSAGGYVDHFYEKNGYTCVGLLVPNEWAVTDDLKQRYARFVEPANSESRFAFDVTSMPAPIRQQIVARLEGVHFNAIMDKVIGPPPSAR